MNRDFLVSGAAMGIGLEMCKKVLEGGGRVYMADIDVARGQEEKDKFAKQYGKKVEFGSLDVRSEEDWTRVWDAAEAFFGHQVQGFCNNAGIFHHTDWKKVKDINLDGMLIGSMMAFKRMGTSNGGQGGLMVITGSIASFICGGFDTVVENVYQVTKHGVRALVRTLAVDKMYQQDRVRTVAICPWYADTNLVRTNVGNMDRIQKDHGIRMLRPSEVGDGFERLVVEGQTGDMLAIMPGANFFFPNWDRKVFGYSYLLAKLAKKVFGLPEERIVTEKDLVWMAGILLFVAFVLLHVLLSWIGL